MDIALSYCLKEQLWGPLGATQEPHWGRGGGGRAAEIHPPLYSPRLAAAPQVSILQKTQTRVLILSDEELLFQHFGAQDTWRRKQPSRPVGGMWGTRGRRGKLELVLYKKLMPGPSGALVEKTRAN